MSERVESRMLAEGAALRLPLQRLGDAATEEAQAEWEAARWQRYEAAQRVFDTCQQLLDVLEDAERILNRPYLKER